MPQTAYVYVPNSSRANLDIGIRDGLWGWRSEALDKARGRAVVQSLRVGDFFVLGHGGPSPRVAPDGWRGRTLKRVIVGQVTRTLYESRSEVWPDDVYPERIGIEVLGEYDDGATLQPGAMEALRLSGTKQGGAVMEPGTGAATLIALAATEPVEDDPTDEAADVEGDTDVMRAVLVRREQARLRRLKFEKAKEIQCAICGRLLPARIVHAAHIKRRKDANYRERIDLSNIMGACTLGCDTLFEFGHIYVDGAGIVRINPAAPRTLADAAARLTGAQCEAFSSASAVHFEYHRTEVAEVGSSYPAPTDAES